MKQNHFNFTKQSLSALRSIEDVRLVYHDTREKGLCLYVTSNGTKTFFIRKRVNGRDEKIVLGRFPDISIEQARKLAQVNKGEVAKGLNPNTEKKKLKHEMTLKVLFDEYLERYAKQHKKTWEYDEKQFKRYLSTWQYRKLTTIQKQDIERLHHKIGDEHGLYAANRLLSFLKTLFNKAKEWGWDGGNPANGVKKFREKSRDRFLQPQELPRFFKALEQETNQTIKDYVWLSLLTGARKSNVLSMKWDEINITRKTWHITETKNYDSVDIPLVKEALDILKRRKKESESDEWVFPSFTSESGHLMEPKRVWQRVLKTAKIENLRIHDIRRTLGSYQAITGASMLIIGKTLGHKSQQSTQVYSRLNDDPVRVSMGQAIKLIMEESKK